MKPVWIGFLWSVGAIATLIVALFSSICPPGFHAPALLALASAILFAIALVVVALRVGSLSMTGRIWACVHIAFNLGAIVSISWLIMFSARAGTL